MYSVPDWTCPGFVEGLGLGIRVSDLTAFCPPVWCHSFVRPPAEPFFHPGPHDGAAVARSGGQPARHWAYEVSFARAFTSRTSERHQTAETALVDQPVSDRDECSPTTPPARLLQNET